MGGTAFFIEKAGLRPAFYAYHLGVWRERNISITSCRW